MPVGLDHGGVDGGISFAPGPVQDGPDISEEVGWCCNVVCHLKKLSAPRGGATTPTKTGCGVVAAPCAALLPLLLNRRLNKENS